MSLFRAENAPMLIGVAIVFVTVGGWIVFTLLQKMDARQQQLDEEEEQEPAEDNNEERQRKMEEKLKKMEEKQRAHINKRGQKVKAFRMQGEYGARKFIKP
jgi:uncharacterized protein HemX